MSKLEKSLKASIVISVISNGRAQVKKLLIHDKKDENIKEEAKSGLILT